MRVLFDTNVILDVLLDRSPHALEAAELFARTERGNLIGLVGATTLTTIHYLARTRLGDTGARGQIQRLLELFEVAPVSRAVLEGALRLDFGDFEDAVLHEAGRHAAAEAVVTRDAAGFRNASLAIYAPGALLAVLRAVDEQG